MPCGAEKLPFDGFYQGGAIDRPAFPMADLGSSDNFGATSNPFPKKTICSEPI
jgi:hypothetical protein